MLNKKMLIFCTFMMTILTVNAMDCGCDYVALNRRANSYALSINNSETVLQQIIERSLQFLSPESIKIKPDLLRFNSESFFNETIEMAQTSTMRLFAETCKTIFGKTDDTLTKVAVGMLLDRTISEFRSMKPLSSSVHPILKGIVGSSLTAKLLLVGCPID